MTVINAEIVTANARVQLRSARLTNNGRFVRTREDYHLTYNVSRASCEIRTASGLTAVCNPGTVSVVAPRVPLMIDATAGDQECVICEFQPHYFEEITGIRKVGFDTELEFSSNIRSSRLSSILKRICEELREPGFSSELFLEAASTCALVDLGRYLRTSQSTKACYPARDRGLAPRQLKLIHERIAAINEMGSPSLRELATLCGISQFHMLRNFKASTGTTVRRHIEDVRLTAAKNMLSAAKLSAKEIALKLHFSNPSYFATVFRRATGMTPTEYRVRSLKCR